MVGTPLTHQRFLRRKSGAYGPRVEAGKQTLPGHKTPLDNFYITGVQLERGKNATDFEHRSIGEELALCQRYYTQANTSGAGNPLLYFMQYSNSYRMLVADFPTTMRAAPSFQVTMGTGADGTGLTQSYNTSPHQGKAYVNVASTSANASWIWKYTADAEL